MSNTELCFFYLWMVVSSALMVAGSLGALIACFGWWKGRNSWRLVPTFLVAFIMASLVHPIVNTAFFYSARQRTIAVMLQEVGTPAYEIQSKYGEPKATFVGPSGVRWRYAPGPWYVLMPWEEVIFEFKKFQVARAFVDD